MEPSIIIAALYGFWLGIALMGLYTLRALRKELASSEKKLRKRNTTFLHTTSSFVSVLLMVVLIRILFLDMQPRGTLSKF